jgi:hypothetical protein
MMYTCLRFIAKPFLHCLLRIEITGIDTHAANAAPTDDENEVYAV